MRAGVAIVALLLLGAANAVATPYHGTIAAGQGVIFDIEQAPALTITGKMFPGSDSSFFEIIVFDRSFEPLGGLGAALINGSPRVFLRADDAGIDVAAEPFGYGEDDPFTLFVEVPTQCAAGCFVMIWSAGRADHIEYGFDSDALGAVTIVREGLRTIFEDGEMPGTARNVQVWSGAGRVTYQQDGVLPFHIEGALFGIAGITFSFPPTFSSDVTIDTPTGTDTCPCQFLSEMAGDYVLHRDAIGYEHVEVFVLAAVDVVF